MVEEIVSTINATDNPRALVFCRSIKHAERLLVFFKTEFEGGRHEGRLSKFNNVDL